ncbi:MAG: Flp pilus assembly complex ATPase component TadA [Candidatus Omnitrophica bacterium]|nr:Flp pilus assembly complex ATPase component TadA [Candidatus Omnitrophota bacterium]
MAKDINEIKEEVKTIVQDRVMQATKKDLIRSSDKNFRKDVVTYTEATLLKLLKKNKLDLSNELKKEIIDQIVSELCGYGSLEQVLEDPYITDIMVNSPSQVFIEKEGKAQRLKIKFRSQAEIKTIIERMMISSSKRINQASPFVDFRLEDGSRVTAVIPPVAKSPALCIRKFSKERFETKDLLAFGTLDQKILDFLCACIRSKINILITGSTGAGKTTLLTVLANLIDPKERIVVLEDTEELSIAESRHFLKLLTRPPSIEEKGEIGLDNLVRLSLHLRPDRIIIGEVRGEEAFYFLQAINTGHEGSMCTLHAEHTVGALNRLETLGLMAKSNMQLEASKRLVGMGIDLSIHLKRTAAGKRVISQISEVDYKDGQSLVKNIFLYKEKFETGQEKDYFEFTGNIPGFIDKLEARSGYSKDKLIK